MGQAVKAYTVLQKHISFLDNYDKFMIKEKCIDRSICYGNWVMMDILIKIIPDNTA